MEEVTKITLKHIGNLHRSLVVCDQVAQVVAFGAGLQALTDLGAVGVCDLHALTSTDIASAACLAGGHLQRVVIIISAPFHTLEQPLVTALLTVLPCCTNFTILSTLSEAALHDELPSIYSQQCFQEWTHRIQQRVARLRSSSSNTPLIKQQSPMKQAGPACHINISYIPLLLLPLSSSVFVMPSDFGSVVSQTRAAGKLAGYSTQAIAEADSSDEEDEAMHMMTSNSNNLSVPSTADLTATKQPPPTQGLTLLAHSLAHIVALLGFRPEAFCLGPTSKALGRSLSFIPPPQLPGHTAPSETPAAIVLVDRALDVVSPNLHADLLVSRMFDALLTTPTASSSQQQQNNRGFVSPAAAIIPVSDPDSALGSQSQNDDANKPPSSSISTAPLAAALPGTLYHPSDPSAQANLGFLLTRKGKDAALFIRKWLREAIRKEGLKPQGRFKPGTVSPEELKYLANLLNSASPGCALRHASIIQLSTAAALTMEPEVSERWDVRAATERALLLGCARGSALALEQLLDLCETVNMGRGLLTVDDVLHLTLIAYCVLPDYQPWFHGGGGGGNSQVFAEKEEKELREAVDKMLRTWQQNQRQANGSIVETIEQIVNVDALFNTYRELSAFRQKWLTDAAFRAPSNESDVDIEEGQFQSLLLQLTQSILQGKPIQGLHHAGTSLAGLLKSGFSKLGLSKKQPMPSDCSTVILFVVGGITAAEGHEVRAAVEARAAAGEPCVNVIVGGSALLQPSSGDMLTKLMNSY